jgi:hypothetical protein
MDCLYTPVIPDGVGVAETMLAPPSVPPASAVRQHKPPRRISNLQSVVYSEGPHEVGCQRQLRIARGTNGVPLPHYQHRINRCQVVPGPEY